MSANKKSQVEDSTRILITGISVDADTNKVYVNTSSNPSGSEDNLEFTKIGNTNIDTTLLTISNGWVFVDWYVTDDSSNVATYPDSILQQTVSNDVADVDSVYAE